MSFDQKLTVQLEGRAPFDVVCDQRDIAQLELQEWYGSAPLTALRHLAYTACRRQGHIPADTTWPEFSERLAVTVDAADEDDEDDEEEQEGEQGADPTGSTPGPPTTSGPASSTSRKRPGSRSPGRQGSKAGTPAT